MQQSEADELIKAEKKFDPHIDQIEMPLGGSSQHTLTLRSDPKRAQFHVDLSRHSISLRRAKYNARVNKSTVLIRIDLHGRHKNPDGQQLDGPHIHTYREGYGTRFAEEFVIQQGWTHDDVLEDFLSRINATGPAILRHLPILGGVLSD